MEDEHVMTAEEVAAELGQEPGGRRPEPPVDHEAAAAAAEPAPSPHDRAPEVGGLLAELSRVRTDRRAMREELEALKRDLDERNKLLEESLKPVGEFVTTAERERAEKARLESAPDPEQDPRGYALWAMRQESQRAMAPVEERIGKLETYLEKISTAIDAEQQQQQQQQQAQQAIQRVIQAAQSENASMSPDQAAARDAFLARRQADWTTAGLDERTAALYAADDLREQYRLAFDRYGEIGHGGEYLEAALRAWGWPTKIQQPQNGDGQAAEAASYLAAAPPDIARRQRQQRMEQPPAASARSSSGNDGWAEFKRLAPELARQNPSAFEAKLEDFARRKGISVDDLERELVA